MSSARLGPEHRLAPATAPTRVRGTGWIENRPPSGWLPRVDLRELWAYRELALSFAVKALKVRYKQTFFGVAWVVFQPLVAVLLFTVVFDRLAGLPSEGIPYPVFAYAGTAIWLYASGSVNTAAQSLVENRELVTKVYFPRILAPLAALLPGLVDLAISLGILAVFMAVYGVSPGIEILTLPLWVAAALLVALGMSLWLSALNVKYRDVKHVLGFMLQIWLFASPVAYSSSLVDGGWRWLYAANPLVAVLDGFRWAAVGGNPPGVEDLVSLAVALALLLGGAVSFARLERFFADLA